VYIHAEAAAGLLLIFSAKSFACIKDGRSALYLASVNGDHEIAQLLLNHNANISVVTNVGSF
jgi:ankyrin repeat protein